MSSTNVTSPAGNATTNGYNPANDNETATFLAVVTVAWTCAFLTAMLRFYTRTVLVRSFGKDDVFMALSVVSTRGSCMTHSQVPKVANGPAKAVWDRGVRRLDFLL